MWKHANCALCLMTSLKRGVTPLNFIDIKIAILHCVLIHSESDLIIASKCRPTFCKISYLEYENGVKSKQLLHIFWLRIFIDVQLLVKCYDYQIGRANNVHTCYIAIYLQRTEQKLFMKMYITQYHSHKYECLSMVSKNY